MNTDKLLRILEGSLAEHKADLAQAEDEAEGAKEAIDFTQTLIDLVRDKHEGLPVTERDEVVSWFKYRNGTFTTTLGEVGSVADYDALQGPDQDQLGGKPDLDKAAIKVTPDPEFDPYLAGHFPAAYNCQWRGPQPIKVGYYCQECTAEPKG